MTRDERFKKITRMLKEQGAKRIAIFGSYAREEESLHSDIDVMVEFKERKTLLELVRIERALSETLGIGVDLVTEKFISPYLIEGIKTQMKVIYG